METQHNLSRVLREVAEGHVVEITRRKNVVARIVAPPTVEPVQFPDFAARAARTWRAPWHGASSDKLVSEGRGDR